MSSKTNIVSQVSENQLIASMFKIAEELKELSNRLLGLAGSVKFLELENVKLKDASLESNSSTCPSKMIHSTSASIEAIGHNVSSYNKKENRKKKSENNSETEEERSAKAKSHLHRDKLAKLEADKKAKHADKEIQSKR